MNFRNVTKLDFKHPNGYLPINKPKGIDVYKIQSGIINEWYHSSGHFGVKSGRFEATFSRYLEPSASGLLTFVLGHHSLRKRNFAYAEYKYRATIKFDLYRKFNDVDETSGLGKSVDFLDAARIEASLRNLVGPAKQNKRGWNDVVIPASNSSSELSKLYDRMSCLEDTKKNPKNIQKYPICCSYRMSSCNKLTLLDFTNPYATVDIECQGSFNIQDFTKKIGQEVGSCAHLVELIRLREGPMLLDDLRVVQLHETKVDDYFPRVAALKALYTSYLSRFDDRFESPTFKPDL